METLVDVIVNLIILLLMCMMIMTNIRSTYFTCFLSQRCDLLLCCQ